MDFRVPFLSDTFFQKARELARTPLTFPNKRLQVASDGSQYKNVCVGWYDTNDEDGGWASIVVVENTGVGYPFGTDAIINNGSSGLGHDWQMVKWPAAAAQGGWIYLQYREDDGTRPGDTLHSSIQFGGALDADSQYGCALKFALWYQRRG
jgi:hypothetical protein